MDALNLFKLNDRPVNFNLIDQLEFTLHGDVLNFNLSSEQEGNLRLLEDDFVRLLEDGTFRLLENA